MFDFKIAEVAPLDPQQRVWLVLVIERENQPREWAGSVVMELGDSAATVARKFSLMFHSLEQQLLKGEAVTDSNG